MLPKEVIYILDLYSLPTPCQNLLDYGAGRISFLKDFTSFRILEEPMAKTNPSLLRLYLLSMRNSQEKMNGDLNLLRSTVFHSARPLTHTERERDGKVGGTKVHLCRLRCRGNLVQPGEEDPAKESLLHSGKK